VFSLTFPIILQITLRVGFKERQSIIRMYCLKTYGWGELIVLLVLGIEITNYVLFPHESNTLTASLGQAYVIFTH
jgi:hypothetical protein